MSEAFAAAGRFALGGPVDALEPVSGGHIHHTWRVSAGGRRWIVQRLNTLVFPDPDAVMANLVLLAGHVPAIIGPVLTRHDRLLWRGDGGVWRAFPYLEGTSPPRPPHSPATASVVAGAFAAFHRATADFDGRRLVEVLPGFHDLRRRLAALAAVFVADPVGRAVTSAPERSRIARLGWIVDLAAGLRAPGVVPLRVAHFDAKADNVLIDDATGAAAAIVDVDTAMAGSLLWDVGDLVRSLACPVAEDGDPSGADLDMDIVVALLDGYRSAAGSLLTPAEVSGLVTAPLVVTLEQAARFLTDHLAGDRYYRIAREGHNLERARVQLALVESMVDCRSAMIAAL